MTHPAPLTPFPSAPRRTRRFAVAASLLVVAGVAATVAPTAAQQAVPGPTSMAAAQATLDRARTERQATESRLAAARRERKRVQARLARLQGSDAALTTELADARRQAREFAVAAFIDGGQAELVRASLSPEQASALAWRTGLVSGQAGQASDAADRYQTLREANDPDRVAAAVDLDRATRTEAEATSDLNQASALERDAEAALAAAGAATRASQARQAAARTTTTVPAAPGPATTRKAAPRAARAVAPSVPAAALPGPAQIGDATADELAFLAKVRRCESGGNYAAVSSTGRYRGAYQFSVETWRGVGGTGDPAAASPAEQDRRALALLRLQGKRAWPVCSR